MGCFWNLKDNSRMWYATAKYLEIIIMSMRFLFSQVLIIKTTRHKTSHSIWISKHQIYFHLFHDSRCLYYLWKGNPLLHICSSPFSITIPFFPISRPFVFTLSLILIYFIFFTPSLQLFQFLFLHLTLSGQTLI